MGFYDFEAMDIRGTMVQMKEYAGKVVLVVNTAIRCGFTPQYDGLQDLYEKYQGEGLEILDFPSNQFGQALESDEEIASFCDSRFGITFPHFSKIDVNGESALPLYQFLQKEKGFEGFDPEHPFTPMLESMLEHKEPNYKNTSDIKWNFTKFLIDRQGNVVARFEPTEDIEVIEKSVKDLLYGKIEDTKMEYNYTTKDTCSTNIKFDIEGNVIRNIVFTGGCNGNLKTIPILVDGWTVEEIEEKCKGITCGRRPTSCADQLAHAVREAYEAVKAQA